MLRNTATSRGRPVRNLQWFFILMLAACQQPEKPDTTTALPPFPADIYLEAHARAESVFEVDRSNSEATILVRREGALARLGHDHAIVARPLEGYVLIAGDSGQSRADLRVYAVDLQVDPPQARQALGLDTQPSPEDIQGTRKNMLSKVLDAGNWPEIRIALRGLEPAGENSVLQSSISIRGVTRSQSIPVQIQQSADGLESRGRLTIRQTDFGIEPLSALGGGLRVGDEVQVEFLVLAKRLGP